MRALKNPGPNAAFVAKTYLAEVAKLARKAERCGAPPQASKLMAFAERIDMGDYHRAACIRDLIKTDLDEAIHRRRKARFAILANSIEVIAVVVSETSRSIGMALMFIAGFIPFTLLLSGIAWLAYTMAHPFSR